MLTYDPETPSHSRSVRVWHGAARKFRPGANAYAPRPASPYGGTTVEDIIARVNDQIITSSDYDRAMKELDQEERQRGRHACRRCRRRTRTCCAT